MHGGFCGFHPCNGCQFRVISNFPAFFSIGGNPCQKRVFLKMMMFKDGTINLISHLYSIATINKDRSLVYKNGSVSGTAAKAC